MKKTKLKLRRTTIRTLSGPALEQCRGGALPETWLCIGTLRCPVGPNPDLPMTDPCYPTD